MPIGVKKIHGDHTHVLVNFGNASHEVDEFTYRRLNYTPDFDALPWAEAANQTVLLIDVMPLRRVKPI